MLPIAAIAALVQGGIGIAKAASADANRPKYKPSKEDKEALALARAQATDKLLPGQSGLEDAISLSSANALNASAMSGGENLAGIVAAENKARRNLGIASAEHQSRDVANLQAALAAMGAKRDLQFQMNEFAPYAQKSQEGRDMIGAAVTNVNNAYMYDKILGGGGMSGGGNIGGNVPDTSSISNPDINSKVNTSNIDWDLIRYLQTLKG